VKPQDETRCLIHDHGTYDPDGIFRVLHQKTRKALPPHLPGPGALLQPADPFDGRSSLIYEIFRRIRELNPQDLTVSLIFLRFREAKIQKVKV
jgi:hypothetical protein